MEKVLNYCFKVDKITKKRNNSTLSDKIIFKKKIFFEKDSPTKGRPSIASDVVDILSDLQTKNYVSANQVGDVLRRTSEFWSNFKYAPDRLISKQSALRSLVIKGLAGDLKIAQILS